MGVCLFGVLAGQQLDAGGTKQRTARKQGDFLAVKIHGNTSCSLMFISGDHDHEHTENCRPRPELMCFHSDHSPSYLYLVYKIEYHILNSFTV